jgi:hypothetical protein
MAEVARRADSAAGAPKHASTTAMAAEGPDGYFAVPIDCRGMTDGAQLKFAESVREFAAALARETARLEEAGRDQVVHEVEITTTMVVRADEVVRRGPLPEIERKRSTFATSVQVVGMASLAGVGVLGSYLRDLTSIIIFTVVVLVALAINGYVIRRRL